MGLVLCFLRGYGPCFVLFERLWASFCLLCQVSNLCVPKTGYGPCFVLFERLRASICLLCQVNDLCT